MSNKIGLPARHTSVVTNRAVLMSATAIAAASLVAVAYTLAAPPHVAAAETSVVTANSTSSLVRLSAAGLDSLLNARFAPIHTAVTSQGNTAAQQVSIMLGDGSGQTSSDGKVLTLHVPAIRNIGVSVATALRPLNAQMGDLSGSNGQVANSVNRDVVKISPLLDLTGSHAKVSANVPIDVAAALAPQLAGSTQQGVVSINPHAGTVAIDLSNLLADNGDGSQSLSPDAVTEITADVNAAAAGLGDNLVNTATDSVENTPVNVDANVNLVSAPSSTSSGSCDSATSSQTSTPGGGLLSGLLGNTLNGVLGGTAGGTVGGTVSGLLCSLPTNLLGGLLSSLGLNLNGTVGQIIEGTAPPATGSVTVLGSPRPFNGVAFNSSVANSLVTNFGGSTGSGGTDGTGVGTTGSDGTGLGLTVGANLGDGGLGLGGLNLGGAGLGGAGLGDILGSQGTGLNSGFLNSLLVHGHGNLPVGISANVGAGMNVGAGAASASAGNPSGGGILNLHATTGGNRGLSGTVQIGTPSTGSSSSGNSLINLGF